MNPNFSSPPLPNHFDNSSKGRFPWISGFTVVSPRYLELPISQTNFVSFGGLRTPNSNIAQEYAVYSFFKNTTHRTNAVKAKYFKMFWNTTAQ